MCTCVATARDRLQHIAIMMQAEVIKSLQMAAKHETAVLNLRLLHEASIMNRKDTFAALDELKQRIIMTRRVDKQIEGSYDVSRQCMSVASAQTVQTASFNPATAIPHDYIPPAVQLAPVQDDGKETRSGLSRYFQIKRNSSIPVKAVSNQSNALVNSANINFSAAFEQYVRTRGSEDQAVIMKDIEEIMSSYKGLEKIDPESKEPWGRNQTGDGLGIKRDTLNILHAEDNHEQDATDYNWDETYVPQSESYSNHGTSTVPAFKNVFGVPQNQHFCPQQYPANHPLSPTQRQGLNSRVSDTSTVSVNDSDMSFGRNGSNSSQKTPSQISHLSSNDSSLSDHRPFAHISQQHQKHGSDHRRAYSNPPGSSVPVGFVLPIAPLSVTNPMGQSNAKTCSSPHALSPNNAQRSPHELTRSLSQGQYVENTQHFNTFSNASNTTPYAHAAFGAEPYSPSVLPSQISSVADHDSFNTHRSTNERTSLQPAFVATASMQTLTPLATADLRHPSIASSFASTESSGSSSVGVLPRPRGSIRSDTIQSPPLGRECMMEGRPCKDNNYWGFCKGAWAVREDIKKGLSLCKQPQGMYHTREIWECQHCNFWGRSFSAPHPTRRNKRDTIVDPNIHTSKSGIRYRWIFLVKSHVRRKSNDLTPDEGNYGCLICSVEGNVTGIYGNVDTLMYHILEHVAGMTGKSMAKTKCIIGRTAGAEEEWDINVPLFADVSEIGGR
jgi:hypothetical protein